MHLLQSLFVVDNFFVIIDGFEFEFVQIPLQVEFLQLDFVHLLK